MHKMMQGDKPLQAIQAPCPLEGPPTNSNSPGRVMVDFMDAARLESDKLCRRLVEDAAMEAQLVSKVLAAEAQFQQDRRASLTASYGGAMKKAKQEGTAASPSSVNVKRDAWEDVRPDEEDDVAELEAEDAAEARLQLERRASLTASYAGAAKTAKQEGSAASPAKATPLAKAATPPKARRRLADTLEAEDLDRRASDAVVRSDVVAATGAAPAMSSATPAVASTPSAPLRAAIFTEGDVMLICAVLIALAVYMLSAWLQELPAPLPIACSWDWRTLRCPQGCKMLLPGKCKLA
jgi:hypothetical protein